MKKIKFLILVFTLIISGCITINQAPEQPSTNTQSQVTQIPPSTTQANDYLTESEAKRIALEKTKDKYIEYQVSQIEQFTSDFEQGKINSPDLSDESLAKEGLTKDSFIALRRSNTQKLRNRGDPTTMNWLNQLYVSSSEKTSDNTYIIKIKHREEPEEGATVTLSSRDVVYVTLGS